MALEDSTVALATVVACKERLRLLFDDGPASASQILPHILEFENVPMTYEILKQTTIGRDINHANFRHHVDATVRHRSEAFVAKWRLA